jgi:DNA-binding NarL/FixJ family response regulator
MFLFAAACVVSWKPRTSGKCLMVTLHDSPQLVEEARRVGIRGVCPKTDIECVVDGVTTVLDNKLYFKN